MIEPSHILVVDQDADTRSLLQETFGGAGYRVSLAASGEEALAYLHLITPDLILFNLLLPDKNGLELTRRLKTDTSKPFIPIIIITERTDLEASVVSLDAGADDFLVKPLAVDELLARVRAMLRLQRAQRGLQNEQRKTELLLHLTRELGASIELDTLLTRFLDHLVGRRRLADGLWLLAHVGDGRLGDGRLGDGAVDRELLGGGLEAEPNDLGDLASLLQRPFRRFLQRFSTGRRWSMSGSPARRRSRPIWRAGGASTSWSRLPGALGFEASR